MLAMHKPDNIVLFSLWAQNVLREVVAPCYQQHQ